MELTIDGIPFYLGGHGDRQKNVLACEGQKILIPKTGQYNKLYVLAAAEHDTSGIFKAGRTKMDFSVQSFNGNICEYVMNLKEELIRKELIKMGWTPPT